MTSIATNANNDIYVGPDGNLVMVTGVDAVQQDCEHAMKAQLGEMPLNLTRGVPTLATIWSKWNPKAFEAAARALLLTVPNVVAVQAFSLNRIGGVANYTATIQTIYGGQTVDISGELVK